LICTILSFISTKTAELVVYASGVRFVVIRYQNAPKLRIHTINFIERVESAWLSHVLTANVICLVTVRFLQLNQLKSMNFQIGTEFQSFPPWMPKCQYDCNHLTFIVFKLKLFFIHGYQIQCFGKTWSFGKITILPLSLHQR
jgi:hypothetical protein